MCEESEPCENGGTCENIRRRPGYICYCPKILEGIFKGIPLYVGPNCEHKTPLNLPETSTTAVTQTLSGKAFFLFRLGFMKYVVGSI